jgi:uncharacterized protein (UPF0212 family)
MYNYTDIKGLLDDMSVAMKNLVDKVNKRGSNFLSSSISQGQKQCVHVYSQVLLCFYEAFIALVHELYRRSNMHTTQMRYW